MDSWCLQTASGPFVLNGPVAFEAPNAEDKYPLPSDWCQWGFIRPEKLISPARDGATSAKTTADEFVFDRPNSYAQVSKGRVVHEGESSSCAWEGHSLNCSSRTIEDPVNGQTDFQMHNNLDWIDDIFLNSLLEDDNGNMQNTSQSLYMPDSISRSESFENFMTGVLTDPQNPMKDTARRETLVTTSNIPLLTNTMSEPWGKIGDSSSSYFTLEEPKSSAGLVTDPCLSVLMPIELSASNQSEAVAYVDEPECWEASVLQELEDITIHLSDNMRMCFRDALYRLAKNSKEQHGVNQNRTVNVSDRLPTGIKSESSSLGGSCHGESRTNVVDRTIANLMFNNPYFHAPEVSCGSGSIHSGTGDLASHGSYFSPECPLKHQFYVGPT